MKWIVMGATVIALAIIIGAFWFFFRTLRVKTLLKEISLKLSFSVSSLFKLNFEFKQSLPDTAHKTLQEDSSLNECQIDKLP